MRETSSLLEVGVDCRFGVVHGRSVAAWSRARSGGICWYEVVAEYYVVLLLRNVPGDNASAEDVVSVVGDGYLAGCRCPDGLFEVDPYGPVIEG